MVTEMQVMKLAMQLNYMQYGIPRSDYRLEEDEVNLFFNSNCWSVHSAISRP
jgi:hypothetical protein